MKKFKYALLGFLFLLQSMTGQQKKPMTPQDLLSLNRLSILAVSPDENQILYKISSPDVITEKSETSFYLLDTKGNKIQRFNTDHKAIFQWDEQGLYADEDGKIYLSKDLGKTWLQLFDIKNADNFKVSPDGNSIAYSKNISLEKVLGKEKYPELKNATAQIYTDLDHRHWDTWKDGTYQHIFISTKNNKKEVEILADKKYDSPQKPFGGSEDFVWSKDSKSLFFVTKEKSGAEYAKSTNTDIFQYNLSTGELKNITKGMMGYDISPKLSPNGDYLAFLSMKRDRYEADKNDIIILNLKTNRKINLTQNWDESVTGDLIWTPDGKNILFTAAQGGTKNLYITSSSNPGVTKLLQGKFDCNDIISSTNGKIFFTRTDFNHTADLFSYSTSEKSVTQHTDINKEKYAALSPSNSELVMVKSTDGKDMGVWMIFPPNFDSNKKYPTLLYCQGGPQSALTQFFSYRWNMALMAAQGYIVVAPNRRGMPGWGTSWNESISKDWGGQPIRDYLSATDYAAKLPYVDASRMAAVGASYGGYSVFMLAGLHENRFKSFIAHDGIFDSRSWYLNTEELWFANWDLGSPFDKPLPKAYTDFNPISHIDKWNKPIMIVQGGKDFRVGFEQGQAAFQAAKLKGLKSKFVYFPDENHWVLKPQNSMVWQNEFFEWLKETL